MLDAALIWVGCRGYPCVIWRCLCSGCFLSLQEEQKSPSVTTDSFVVGAVLSLSCGVVSEFLNADEGLTAIIASLHLFEPVSWGIMLSSGSTR